ncbi:CPBP family intramembrane glutamic endopeptidase [Actinopolymorpha alba]|uniref:CPBP family intramembrane glutamic endopeptidase n=1 Tax=Actinopolymorpha alba TaxID=533267 RepID=UPI00037C570A|nr:type II CAAX endopeptidase family protein [Actinopolymorpha alba]
MSILLVALGVEPVTAGIIATPVGWLALGGWPLLVSKRRGNGPRADLALVLRAIDLAIGVVGGVIVLAASVVFVLIYVQVTGREPTSALGAAAATAHAHWQVIALAVIALAAPFVEELHFRGMWWSALRRKGLGPWPTLFVTAILFSVAHLEPTRAALLFAAGLAAGFVRMVTDRLGPAIITHLVVNAIAVIGLLSLL